MPRPPARPGTTLGDLLSIAAPQTSVQDRDLLGVAVQSQAMTDTIPPNAGATMKTVTVTTPRTGQATAKTVGVLPGSARHMLPPRAPNLGALPPTTTTTHPTGALAPLTGTGAPTSMGILTTMSEARDLRTPPVMITSIVSLGATTMTTGVQGAPTEVAADLVTARKDPTPEITIAPRPRIHPRIQPLRLQRPQRPVRLWNFIVRMINTLSSLSRQPRHHVRNHAPHTRMRLGEAPRPLHPKPMKMKTASRRSHAHPVPFAQPMVSILPPAATRIAHGPAIIGRTTTARPR